LQTFKSTLTNKLMKKTLLTMALVATSIAAFGQGHVAFVNDSVHLFVLGNNVLTADAAYANQPISNTLPSGVTLVAGLYAGTSSSSLALQTSTTALTGTGAPSPGRMAQRNTILNGIVGSVPQWFQIVIYDSTDLTPGDSLGGQYWGASPLFQVTPATGIVSYPTIMPGSGTGLSTLASPLNIVVNAIPEPSSFALAGLGMASLLIFRRRK
jgi:hypothetical protein